MKQLISILPLVLVAACSSKPRQPSSQPSAANKHPVVTIETSGDLYYEEGGDNIQIDLFGNCAPGQTLVYVEVDKKKSASDCKKGRYRFSLNLPPSFFQNSARDKRAPSSQYALKEIKAYHDGHRDLSATSYILIDRKRKEVKSVINKQVRFEKIPTGDYEPITQYNAFGSCTRGALVTIDISSPDRFGHMVSKYDEKKTCENAGGFYFLSQMHGVATKGTQFKIYEDLQLADPKGRQPASQQDVKFKNLFNWKLPIGE